MTQRIRGLACPACDYQYDSITGMETTDEPNEGDISVCVRCGEVASFTRSKRGVLGLREVDIDELKKIYESNPELLELQKDRRSALRSALDAERRGR